MKKQSKTSEALSLLLIFTIGIILISGCIGEEKKESSGTSPAVKPSGTPTPEKSTEPQQTPAQQQNPQPTQPPQQTQPQTPQQAQTQQQNQQPTQTPPVVNPSKETQLNESQKKSAPPIPPGFKAYEDTNRNWSIYYPAGWDIVFSGPNALNLKKQFVDGKNIDDLRLNVKILPQDIAKAVSALSAREFFDKEWTNWVEKPPGYKLNSVEDTEINGVPAVEHVYTDLGTPGSVGIPTKTMDVWIKKDTFVAVVSFSGPAYSFSKYVETFNQIEGTFYITE